MASAAIKGIKIKLEGDTTGLVDSLDAVEKQIKEDDAALKRLDKALKFDPTNVDLLAAKQAILAEKTEAVAEKMNILKELKDSATEAIADGADIAASSMAELEVQLSATATTMTSLESETSATKDAIDNINNGTAGAAGSLDELSDSAEDAGNNLENTSQKAEESKDNVESLGDTAENVKAVFQVAFKAMAAAVTAVTTAAVALAGALANTVVKAVKGLASLTASLAKSTINAAKYADEVKTLSVQTGVSTKKLQEYKYAAELVDVSEEALLSTRQRIVRTLDASIKKESKYAQNKKKLHQQLKEGKITQSEYNQKLKDSETVYHKLGIRLTDNKGKMRDVDDIYDEAIKKLSGMTNETQQAAYATKIFGGQAKELMPILKGGGEAWEKFKQEANDTGYVLSDKTLDAFGELDDKIQLTKNHLFSMRNTFAQVLLPTLDAFGTKIEDTFKSLATDLAGTEGDITKIQNVFQNYKDKLIDIVKDYGPALIQIFSSLANAIIPVITVIAPDLIRAVGSLITEVASTIANNAPAFTTAFTECFKQLAKAVNDVMPVVIPTIITLISQMLKVFLDNASILIDGLGQLLDTIVNTIFAGDTFEKIMTSLTTLILNLVSSLSQNLSMILQSLVPIVIQIIEGLTAILNENLPLIFEGALNIIMALVQGITEALPNLIPTVIEVIFTIVDTLISNLDKLLDCALQLVVALATGIVENLPTLIDKLSYLIGELVAFLTKPSTLLKIINAVFQIIAAIIKMLPEILGSILGLMNNIFKGIVDFISGKGKKDVADSLAEGFGSLIKSATKWGTDMILGFIDGIKKAYNKLKDSITNVAKTIAKYLHFSVPDEGPLADFDKSGGDMILEFIKSMDKEQTALKNALNDTASVISDEMSDTDFNVATHKEVQHTFDYSGGLGRIEQILNAAVGSIDKSNEQQIVIPVYIGNEKLDTLIVNGIDRYNYSTGGH